MQGGGGDSQAQHRAKNCQSARAVSIAEWGGAQSSFRETACSLAAPGNRGNKAMPSIEHTRTWLAELETDAVDVLVALAEAPTDPVIEGLPVLLGLADAVRLPLTELDCKKIVRIGTKSTSQPQRRASSASWLSPNARTGRTSEDVPVRDADAVCKTE